MILQLYPNAYFHSLFVTEALLNTIQIKQHVDNLENPIDVSIIMSSGYISRFIDDVSKGDTDKREGL
jgi:hypothetical protein